MPVQKSKKTLMIERVIIAALAIVLFVLCLFVVLGGQQGVTPSTTSSPIPVATPESE
jgi:hypothetical protein